MSHRRRGHESGRRSSGSGDERDAAERDEADRDRRRRHDERRDRERDRHDEHRDRRPHRSPEPDDEERERRRRGERPPLSDWYCRCGALNFRRRSACYRQNCAVTRAQAQGAAAGGAGITKRLALSGLDTRSGEEAVVRALQQAAPAAAARLTRVALAPPGSGTCHLAYATVADAMDAYAALLAARLRVDGCKISVAYQPDAWPAADPADYRCYYPLPAPPAPAPPSEADRVNAAAAVAHSAISQLQARADRAEERVYPPPDTSLYVYDESSGYYYDPATGLYYDPNTHYYYNSQTGQYLYWNAAKMTYSPASSATATAAAAATPAAPEAPAEDPAEAVDKKKGGEKQDKIKVAKKIAKDMERWAKSQNQKKDAARTIAAAESAETAGGPSSSSADIGFSVLEARAPAVPPIAPAPPLVPSYGAGSDSSGDEDEGIVDLNKLACLLCKRQFPSREVLEKHLKLSDLHRRNLEEHREKSGASAREARVYRDRAAERRLKHGEDDVPPPPRASRPAEAPATPQVVREIGEENVGNRLLQKMGWSAGQGLGREGQGRVDPLEARAGPQGAGLGQKRGIYTAGPGETYRDCVKKLMIARYQDLVENEGNT